MNIQSPKQSRIETGLRTSLRLVIVGFSAAVFSIAIYAGVQFTYQKYFGNSSYAQGILDNPAAADTGLTPDKGLLLKSSEGFRLVTRKVGPAVVTIKSTKKPQRMVQNPRGKMRRPHPQLPEEEDPLFDFFERFGLPFGMPQQEVPQVGLGSGIIVDKRGYVVTNNHVIQGASEILVNLPGQNTEYKTKVIGTDPKTDLAVLRIEKPGKLPEPAEWADSGRVEVGDWAIAIGSPFALGQSVTVGIISAKGGRNSLELTGAEYAGDLLQTDAAINPGNSGGPLCDIEGRVMGVNTAIYTRSGGYMGIGFAIPSNLAKYVVTTLIDSGKIVRGWLGVYIQPLQPELASELGISNGVGVHEVMGDGPAAKAGLQPGDVIVRIEGQDVQDVTQLQTVISRTKPGQIVKMEVVSYADKKRKTLKVKVGEMPSDEGESAMPGQGTGEPDSLGLVVSPTRSGDGAMVEMIEPGSIADQVGLQPGDVITRVNRTPIKSPASYRKAIKGSRKFFMQVHRRGRKLFFQFTVPE